MDGDRILEVPSLNEFIQNSRGFDKVKILSVGEGQCRAELVVDETHLNPLGVLHGDFVATLVDCISTYAVVSETGSPGSLVDIHICYIKSAKQGDDIIINANMIRSGKSLSFVEVQIINSNTGEILIEGSATKLLMQ